jgi:MFS transporter, ACS family, aldohexuronate transporter
MKVKIPKMRWIIAGLLLTSTMINYTDRVTLSVVITGMRHQLSLSEEDYGQIISIFLFAYAIMYGVSGYVVDRLGTRKGFALFACSWSVAEILHGFAEGKWSLAVYRFLLGLAEPGNFPAAAKAVDEWFPASQRGIGVGFFNAGTSLGLLMTPPIAAFLTLSYGWRLAFVLTGCLGLIWLVLWLILYEPPNRNRWLAENEYLEIKDHVSPAEEGQPAQGKRVDWLRVLKSRQCYTLMIARFFTDPVIYFIIFWLPSYLHHARGFSLAEIGEYAWVPFLVGGVANIFGGWLSGRLMRAGWKLPRARKFALAIGACLLPSAILAPLVPSAGMAIAAISFITLGHAVWITNLLTLPTDLFHGTEVGTASGFSGMAGAVGGIIASLCTGYVVTNFSYTPIFIISGLMHPFALFVVYRLLPDRYFELAR